jgi:leader peptidase (prepilin peptidase)/N-methyltransferase
MTPDTWSLWPAAAAGVFGLVAGAFVPALIARIPEPEADLVPDLVPETVPETAVARDALVTPSVPLTEHVEPKETYASIGQRPGLASKTSLATAVVAAVLAARVGWGGELGFLLYLAPVGVALAVVDWRTRLLPTKVIAPSYAVVSLLVVLAALVSGDWSSVVGAATGWLVAGGTFFVLWFVYPKGMGYGDVRLAGLLGIALGSLGWGTLLTGVYAGFLLGGVGGLLLSSLRIVDRKAYPFGPFMLLGAVVGVLAGPAVSAWYL